MPKKPPEYHDVEVEVDGQTCCGSYYIESGCIHVSYALGGGKATQLGGSNRHSLSKMLLRELVLASAKWSP